MRTRHVVCNGRVVREMEVPHDDSAEASTQTWQPVDERPTSSVIGALPARVSMGFVPPGLRYFRSGPAYTIAALELPPAQRHVDWNATEYEARNRRSTFLVAQPWMVVCGVWNANGNLVGARMFYRPDPLASLDDPLFHTNLPNVTATRYNSTALGWVCLYSDRVDISGKDWGGRVMRLVERCSGGEGYSEANMDCADGRSIYRDRYQERHPWTWKPQRWERISSHRRPENLWRNVLIPARISSSAMYQDRHDDHGKPLTLRQVVEGRATWHYGTVIDLSQLDDLAPNAFDLAYASATPKGATP